MPRIPPKGKPIAPGETRNPKGSSARARQQAMLRKAHKTLSAEEFARMVSIFMCGTPKEMAEANNDPEASVLIKLLAKFLTKAHDKVDMAIFKTLLEATIGRPRERSQVQHSGPDGGAIVVSNRTPTEMLAEVERLRSIRKRSEK